MTAAHQSQMKEDREWTHKPTLEANPQWLIGGLGPGGLDSDWIPENERDCYLEVSLESQTTNPNQQLTISWQSKYL